MITHPCCKINLGLRVLRRRADGYHDLETLFLPVASLHDTLEITPLDAPSALFSATGLPVDGDAADNLCLKAYRLLRADFPQLPAVHIRLHKAIPMGAGLGGGSADAAYTLRMLDSLFALALTPAQLHAYAARLGADCPFFVTAAPALAQGVGDDLTPLAGNPLQGLHLLIAKPTVSVSTREASSHIQCHPHAAGTLAAAADSLAQGVADKGHRLRQLADVLVNDFEAAIFPRHPAVAQLKADFYQQGADFAAMSGSGAAVYALFSEQERCRSAYTTLEASHPEYFFHITYF